MDEEKEKVLINSHINFPSIVKTTEKHKRSQSVASHVASSIATSKGSYNNWKRDKWDGFFYGLWSHVEEIWWEMILQNKCLKKEKENSEKKLRERQQKLSHAEKTINSINKGKTNLNEILTIRESSGVKKDNSKVVFAKSNNQHMK